MSSDWLPTLSFNLPISASFSAIAFFNALRLSASFWFSAFAFSNWSWRAFIVSASTALPLIRSLIFASRSFTLPSSFLAFASSSAILASLSASSFAKPSFSLFKASFASLLSLIAFSSSAIFVASWSPFAFSVANCFSRSLPLASLSAIWPLRLVILASNSFLRFSKSFLDLASSLFASSRLPFSPLSFSWSCLMTSSRSPICLLSLSISAFLSLIAFSSSAILALSCSPFAFSAASCSSSLLSSPFLAFNWSSRLLISAFRSFTFTVTAWPSSLTVMSSVESNL